MREALGRIIAEPTNYRIGFKEKPTFKGHTPPALRGDEEAQIPGAIDRATSPR